MNLTGVFLCAQAVGKRMILRGSGCIINVASIYGLRAVAERATYVASKFGVVGLTQALAVGWAPRGVRVNAIAPGYTDAELFRRAQAEGGVGSIRSNSPDPPGRLGTTDEIANSVVSLASPEAPFIIGHTLAVYLGWVPDGGW